MRDPDKAPKLVRALAVRLGFEVSPMRGSDTSAWCILSASRTAAPLEVYFARKTVEDNWLWQGAVHRVHHSDPIARNNGGQPELTTFTAFKAYLSLLSVTLK